MREAMKMGAGTLFEVTPSELAERLRAGTAIAIDVREPAEQARGTVAGAQLVPLSRFDLEAVEALRDGEILPIFYCHAGGRTMNLATQLLGRGWTEVVHLNGGLLAWVAEGLPIEPPTAS